MNFFISDAMAAAGQTGQADPFLSLLPLIIIFAIFWFLIMRPQTKRAKEHRQMVSELAKGDEVITQGGVLGRITDVGETFLTLEIADGVQVKVQKNAAAQVVPKGTIKGKDVATANESKKK
jgi:preprotein translocase subunit YajC